MAPSSRLLNTATKRAAIAANPQPAWRQTLHAFDGLLAAILFDVVFGSRARPSILLLPVLPGESTLK
jgi:hypothetical protein